MSETNTSPLRGSTATSFRNWASGTGMRCARKGLERDAHERAHVAHEQHTVAHADALRARGVRPRTDAQGGAVRVQHRDEAVTCHTDLADVGDEPVAGRLVETGAFGRDEAFGDRDPDQFRRRTATECERRKREDEQRRDSDAVCHAADETTARDVVPALRPALEAARHKLTRLWPRCVEAQRAPLCAR